MCVDFAGADPEELRRRLEEYWHFVQTPEAARVLDEIHASLASKPNVTDRTTDARWLLSHADFMRVEAIGGSGRAYGITFNGLAAQTFQDLVIETTLVARGYPGVSDARHKRREPITLEGRFDASGLEQYLRAWWLERLRQEAE